MILLDLLLRSFMKKFYYTCVFLMGFMSLPLMAQNCTTEVKAGDKIQFNVKSITVPKSCKSFEIKLVHEGKLPKNVMGHNIVISETAVIPAVAQAGIKAGLKNEYVPKGDKRIVANTKLIGGGEKTSLKFNPKSLKAGKKYSFFCLFPGHWAVMKGTISVQ